MEGFNVHRHPANPLEKTMHDKFNETFVEPRYSHNTLDKLVYGVTDHGDPKDYLSDHEKRIVLSTIQWLGSPVGQGFLMDCGYRRESSK